MEKKGIIIVSAIAFGIIILLLSNISDLTGYASKGNIIISFSPQETVETNSRHIEAITSEYAECMYNLGDKNKVGFKYYVPMEISKGFKHKHLLKNLKDGEYELSIKCSDKSGLLYRKDFDLVVKLPEVCIPYCQYIDDCDEYAIDGCGGNCNKDTDGNSCGEDMMCSNSFCIIKESPEIIEDKPEGFSPIFGEKRKENVLDRIFSFFRNLFK